MTLKSSSLSSLSRLSNVPGSWTLLDDHINLEKMTAFYTDYNCAIRTLNYIYIPSVALIS